jgi:hypothetical protein
MDMNRDVFGTVFNQLGFAFLKRFAIAQTLSPIPAPPPSQPHLDSVVAVFPRSNDRGACSQNECENRLSSAIPVTLCKFHMCSSMHRKTRSHAPTPASTKMQDLKRSLCNHVIPHNRSESRQGLFLAWREIITADNYSTRYSLA